MQKHPERPHYTMEFSETCPQASENPLVLLGYLFMQSITCICLETLNSHNFLAF